MVSHKYDEIILRTAFPLLNVKCQVTVAALYNSCVLQDKSELKNKFDLSFMA